MINYFKEYIKKPLEKGLDQLDQGIPVPFENFGRLTNYIQRGQFIGISGKSNSGKTSFADYVYLVNVYKWWKKLDDSRKPSLKFIYFNMKHNMRNKLQKWACLDIFLNTRRQVDIPTLNGHKGRLYKMGEEELKDVASCAELFEDMFDKGLLTLVNGPQTPTQVFNKVTQEMKKYGDLNQDNAFEYDKGHRDQITIVIIDNIDYLLTESDSVGTLDATSLKKKMNDYCVQLRNTYGLTVVAVIPSASNNSRNIKESEPNYKELGVFAKGVDLGIVMYNPFNENNMKYGNYDVSDFVIMGKNRLRFASIVRNINGLENATMGFTFLGENGWFKEMPRAEQSTEVEERIDLLRQLL
jgi:hypothetical protein